MTATREASRRARAWLVTAIGAGALCLAAAAQAQSPTGPDPAQAQPAAAAQALQEVVVTGSRIARKSVYDIPNPITQLSPTDLGLTGQVNVEEALSENPQFVGATNGGAQSNVVPGGDAFINPCAISRHGSTW